MSMDKHDTTYRVSGIVGLAALLGLVLWARPLRQVETRQPEDSNPIPHGHAGNMLNPSGRIEAGVRVVAYDAFQYGFDPDPLVVRAGERVRLLVKSRDVTHGAMIPEVDFSTTMPPGNRKEAEFNAPAQPGEYPVFCSVFCGPDHGDMKGRLLVLPAEDGLEPRHE